MAAAYESVPFRSNDDKYKCLCHRVHCQLGVRLLIVFGLVLTAVSIVAIPFQNYSLACLIVHIFFVVLAIIALAGLFWASRSEDERFIYPYYVFTALAVIALLALIVLSVWALIAPQSAAGNFYYQHLRNETEDIKNDEGFEDYEPVVRVVAAVVLVVSVVAIAILAWLLLLAAQYFTFLRDVKIARHPKRILIKNAEKGEKDQE